MLVYKGIFKSKEQLQIAALPDNAVQYKEPDSLGAMNLSAILYSIPILLLGLLVISLTQNRISITGMILFFATMPIHEYLHYLAHPKDANVDLFAAPKELSLFVTSTSPVSFLRYIWICILPNIILGFLPLLFVCFIPNNFVFTIAILSLIGGISDYGNIIRTLKQVPVNATIQNSGIHSYWYI